MRKPEALKLQNEQHPLTRMGMPRKLGTYLAKGGSFLAHYPVHQGPHLENRFFQMQILGKLRINDVNSITDPGCPIRQGNID